MNCFSSRSTLHCGTEMTFGVLCLVLFFFAIDGAEGVRFAITPSTFVPGVTSSVTMRCDVGDKGKDMMQLLLIQLDREDRGNYVPVVTYTPGAGAQIMSTGKEYHVQVDGLENQFQNISSSYLSVTFPFPADQVSANYTCVVSGLSSFGLLVRYTVDATLNIGAVDELPHFMTAYVVELRSLIEKIRLERDALTLDAAQLRQLEENVTRELTSVDSEYATVSADMAAVKARASQLISILNKPVSDLDHLSSVRPEKNVAFHATMSSLGATRAVLHEALVFEHVITNQGQGYDPARGVFRAPVSGTYMLTVSVEAGPGHRDSEISIMNGKDILQTMHLSDDTGYQHQTTSTIVHLHHGQEVTCQFTWMNGYPGYVGSTYAHSPYITAFTGYVLW